MSHGEGEARKIQLNSQDAQVRVYLLFLGILATSAHIGEHIV